MIGQRSSRVSEFERRRLHIPGNILCNVGTVKIFRISRRASHAFSVICKRTLLSLFPALTNSLSFPFAVHDRRSSVRILTRFFLSSFLRTSAASSKLDLPSFKISFLLPRKVGRKQRRTECLPE